MCVWLCVYYPVYLSPVCWVPCRLVYSLFPVFLCVCIALSYLDVVIKDYYFEVYPRLRAPRFSLLCAPWQKTRPNSKRRPFTSFCFVRFFKWFCSFFQRRRSRSSRRRSRINQPAVRRRWRRRPRLTLAHRPAADSMPVGLPLTQCPPDRRWLKPAGSPLTQARRIAADSCLLAAVHEESQSTTPSVSRHRPLLTDPAVRGRSRRRPWGKPTHRPRLPLVRRSRGKPTCRPRSLGPPPAVASSSPRAPAVEWSSQTVMVSPAGRGRILTRLWPKVFLTLFRVCLAPEGSWYPWAAPWIFWGGYKGPGCRGRAEGRGHGHGHEGPPALASWAPCSTLASVCLFRSGGPVLCMSLCRSWGVSRVPTPPPW